MPTYEYACKDCGQQLEVNQKFSDDALTVCPNCGGNLRKVFSAPAISFKGSGFYKNDHGSTSGSPKPSTDASAPAASPESTSKPAEAAPAAKPAETSKPAPTSN